MLIVNKKPFYLGAAMFVSFWIVLALMFMPYFPHDENAFQASDRLFNKISKGSSYYLDDLMLKAEVYKGAPFTASLAFDSGVIAGYAKTLLTTNGLAVSEQDGKLVVSGDTGAMALAALRDSDEMFYNKGDVVRERYGVPERSAMYTWWEIFGELDRDLKRQQLFDKAASLAEMKSKGIEVAYNYYTIEPVKASNHAFILTFSLIFYVAYTLWWGYAIFHLSEGVGFAMTKSAKKEA